MEKEAETEGTEASPGEARSPSLKSSSKSSTQSGTPKRKRPVDPVASLNASIKAKSQLRTQDGKFARNPNKESASPHKSPEAVGLRCPVSGQVLTTATKERGGETSPESSITRSKLRAVSKCKNGDQSLPKRTTRLSSDSDKMPTLEPAVRASSPADEYPEISANDLPILSPATPASTQEKSLRGGKALIGKCSNDKENAKKQETQEPEKRTGSSLKEEEKEQQKQGKGRRAKNDAKSLNKTADNLDAKTDASKEVIKGLVKEKFKRRSAPAKISNAEEKKTTGTVARNTEETSLKKEVKQKKEETVRSNVKTKLESVFDDDDDDDDDHNDDDDSPIKIQNVPFEVKKLIGSDSKEDLLTKLVLTTRIATSKRCLRQPASKFKLEQSRSKSRKDPEVERALKLDSGSTSDASTKKEKLDARRKSLRKTDRKDTKNERTVAEEANRTKDSANEVKSVARGRRSSSLTNESKSLIGSSQPLSPFDVQTKSDTSASTSNAQNADKRQTRGSTLNSGEGNVAQSEDSSLKKNALGKRRGRVKSNNNNDVSDRRNTQEACQTKNEETEVANDVDSTEAERNEAKLAKEENEKKMASTVREHSKGSDRPLESRERDSGKENSVARPAPVQKLKVGRPRKSWGAKKEQASKKSLNNVIGILTEGINIPVDAQPSVLSTQTGTDNVESGVSPQTATTQTDDDASKTPPSLDKSVESSENTVSEVLATVPDKSVADNPCVRRISNEKDPKQTEAAKDPNLEKPTEKIRRGESPSNEDEEQSPANDIILDLSRRKQKGKGSFLEKIVSKIAKQKDALLEGEVGSLLDTAADELTSILNEVGPTFSENAETSTDTRTATKAEKIRDTAQGSEKVEKSADESCPSRDSLVQNLENEENEEKISMELATEFASRVENSNDEEAKDESKVTCKSGEIADQETETKLPMEEQEGDEKENCIDGSKEQDGVIPAETSSATNNSKVLSPAIENTLEIPATNVADAPSSRLKKEKEKHEEVAEEGKVKRRSKKRSLEGKSKKKTTESTDNSEESVVSDELHPPADSIESIEKSKQVPSAEENVPDTGDKPQREEPGTKDVDAAENSNEIVTELAVDPANNTEERTRKNKDQGAEQFEEIADATKIKEEIEATSEEKNSSRKRRCCVEEVDRYSEVQAPVRRSYKRRSHPPEEEKVSQIFEEETVSAETRETCMSEEVTLENARKPRRRSFRTKSTIRREEKSEEKPANEDENNSAVDVSATSITENIELWKSVEESVEKGETVLDETPKQQTTLSDSLEEQSKEKEESSSVKNSEETNKEQIGQTVSVELEKTTEEAPAVAVKVPKKRGRKKKCLTIDQTQSTQSTVSRENPKHESIATSHQLPPRRSLRTNRLAEETESQSKNFNHLANLQVPSSNVEPFKVPEVTELLLQHTKKRTYKRRSTTDENLDVQSNCPRAEPEAGSAECSEEKKSSTEKEDQSENLCQKDPLEEKKHAPESEHVDLERSSSVGSLDLMGKQSKSARTSKRKQLSSEDLSEQGRLNQRQLVESADNLSETSCVSDFSYLRRKRYSKKKKKELRASRREDTSATDSESADVEKSTDRRQILKRRAKKNIFFAEFYLMDDFDIPVDIPDCVSSREDVADAKNDVDQEPEPKLKPPDEEEKLVEGAVSPNEMLVEKPTDEDKVEKRDEDSKRSVEDDDDDEEEQEEEEGDDDEDDEDEDELKNEDQMDEKLDLSQTQDDFQSPKKRAAGNYVVVHKKTGEILIVEKRKKLTKEAARFFCDVCTTSFTRKSSLKKHSQSQSHLLQIVKSKKNAASAEDVENAEDPFAASQNDVSSDENRVESADEATNVLSEPRDDQENGDDASKSAVPEPLRSDLCYSSHLEQNSLMNSPATHQHTLEDELLDEEICKITENMNHDEYVITDQVSSEPESVSTPVKMEVKAVEDVGKRKKKEKAKKKSLIDEQILLDSPELGENPTDDDTLVSVLGANMSIKIAKSSCLNASEANVARRDASESSFEGSRTDILRTRENDFQEPCLDGAAKLQENRDTDVDMEIEDALLRTKVNKIVEDNSIYKVDSEEKNDNFSSVRLDDTDTERNQPYERLSLKLTINARGIEVCKNTDLDKCEYSSAFVKKSEDVTRNCEKNHESARAESIENCSYVEPRTEGSDEDSSSSTPCESQRRGRKSLEHNIDELDVAPKVQRVTETPENAKDQQTESEKQNESGKSPPCHGRSRKVRAKRQSEETEINSEGKATKSLAPRPKVEQNELATKFSESTEASAIDGFNTTLGEKLERLEESSIKNDSVLVLESLESQNVCESNESEELESKRLEENPESAKEITLMKQSMEQQRVPEEETVRSEDRIKSLESIDDDEASSSSSLADKPLSQILLEREQKLDAYKEIIPCSMDAPEDSANESKPESKSKVENERTVDGDYSRANEPIENEKPGDKDSNVDDEQTKIASEEEASKTTEDNSDKDSKISSESENSEAVPPMKNVSKEKELESEIISNVGRKSSASKRATKSHRYSSAKDSHRRARGRKSSIRSKLADLSSESDDSENEGETESQNKSKIVKSVFGRVFGGEKADKVKEVLNDWVSKSEDDSDISRTCFKYSGTNEARAKDCTNEKNSKRHSVSSSSPRKRPGKRSKKNSSSDRAKEKKVYQENQVDEHHSGRHVRSKSSNSKKKHDTEASNSYFLHLPATKCRLSKKRAEELISRTFEDDFTETNVDKSQKSRHKEPNYGLRNQGKPDLTIKDSGYGSFHYDEDSSKMAPMEDTADDEQQNVVKKRKLSDTKRGRGKSEEESWQDLVETEKKASKNPKESDDEEDSLMKGVHRKKSQLINRLSVDLEESSRTSCSSLAPSSVRNRSPSMDRNSQTTRDSDVDDDEEDEDAGHGRISPLFVCGTPRSSVETSSNSENEEEDENLVANDAVTRKSSSEFSGEKIVIRSPCSSHKSEVVTIAPTDAIEDNALDVPQEIETAKPRQGKVLNFDEELFVECCSRLKATTENELRGAKKIKLDHNEGYHRKDEQQQGFRGPRDRWKDVESQNSLGSLLESVNQLLGEEMYSTRERDYAKRGGRNLRSEHSSRSASPDTSRADNLGYEDSLDVAFEHNNKLRDKIQQRMRESENLIASTFSQKSSNDIVRGQRTTRNNELDILTNSYSRLQDQKHLPGPNLSNGGYNEPLHVKGLQDEHGAKVNLDSSGLKGKMNSSLGGLLDKALSNLLHSNEKHDHNGSTPMKVLAELACARAPTTTSEDPALQESAQFTKTTLTKDAMPNPSLVPVSKDLQKKSRNPIKELFERKKEMNERKQQEKSKNAAEAALKELNVHRQRKTKKTKKHQDFPLIRRNEHGGLVERKKRRDGFERKEEFASDRIKDVYEFDEEESQIEPNLGSVMSYRSRPGYEVSCLRTKEVDVAGLMSKAIGDTLENGKTADALSTRLESMIDRKFKELEKFAPKTKGALKAFQSEDQQRQITGPMDEFVERKQPTKASKKLTEQTTSAPTTRHPKLKKRSKNSKKKARNSWYENDSSDEYRTAVKTEDVGVGISKSQRTCSKGKQNIFAELYTSSESEFEDEDADYESKRQRRVKKNSKKEETELENVEQSQELVGKYTSDNEDQADDWKGQDSKNDVSKHDCDNKKSESEMSDHPLVIDERKDVDEQRNSDDETENQYERNFEMDDLYREDSSIVDSDVEDLVPTVEPAKVPEEVRMKSPSLSEEKTDVEKADYMQESELIPLEEALDLLDQADNENSLGAKYGDVARPAKPDDCRINPVVTVEPENETFNSVDDADLLDKVATASPTPVEEQEEEPDDDLPALPEKLSSNEKPQKESENLPLHVFLSRKVQESKKRKEQQLKKMQEEQERILMNFQPTRRQRKCAIGKQGLLAEISSSDEEISPRDRRVNDRPDHDKPRKQKRESKEKRKERYIEKKHEQMIAKEQKAIEEEILREVGKKKESLAQNNTDAKNIVADVNGTKKPTEDTESAENKVPQEPAQKKKHQAKEKQKRQAKTDEEDLYAKNNHEGLSDLENNCNKPPLTETNREIAENNQESPAKQKKHFKSPTKPRKTPKSDQKVIPVRKSKNSNVDRKAKTDSKGTKDKERRSSSGKRDSDDEELKTTKSWNKVEEGVGVAIGRRKRAAANQLYYWSSSSDEEEMLEMVPAVEEEEDDRQEQHGWIVGDSHKRMITMLAMEKQLKEKRRRSEDEFEPGRTKSKKHRNSTS
ncbi:hypothetical protein K0M31_008260 [Melipona bicolor]|uniref:C2H2-type domain-containing protein n=1 Tax=Melipona bicolor TaxID=60889 RepID=A0AA40FQM0_9HYME|nr:hypothetical protein K0M31_008260 [Melipona bicolor]